MILTVYLKDSFFKFEELYQKHNYSVKEGLLSITSINPYTGEEQDKALFANWDYILIEGE